MSLLVTKKAMPGHDHFRYKTLYYVHGYFYLPEMPCQAHERLTYQEAVLGPQVLLQKALLGPWAFSLTAEAVRGL